MKKSRKPDQYDIELGIRLTGIRKAKEISQQELGEFLGVSAQQIGKYERGENRMSTGRYEKAMRWLSLGADPVSAGFGESPGPDYIVTDIKTAVSSSLKRMKDEIGILEILVAKL